MIAAEIRDPIHGYIYLDEVQRDVVDTPTFQRLRRIKQLAGAYLVYPGAHHTRFEHSIGAMYLSGLIADELIEKGYMDPALKEELTLSLLLHDIGHGPFSHVMEEVMAEKGVKHEDLTRRIVRETEVADVLRGYGFDEKRVADLAVGLSKAHPNFMNEVVSGSLSADLMDYLPRDSYFAGVEYGKVDTRRIMSSLEVVNGSLALDSNSLYAFEALLLARYEMFRAVYFHRTVRAGEIMMVKAMELADEELGLTDTRDIQRYLTLTDDHVLRMLSELEPRTHALKRARELALNYKNRRLLKCVFEKLIQRKEGSDMELLSSKDVRAEIEREIASKAKVDPESVFLDVPTAPSIPLSSTKETFSSLTMIFRSPLKREERVIRVEEMPLVSAIRGYLDVVRVYTTKEHRIEVEEAAGSVLGR